MPNDRYDGEYSLALPKLNLQFLTFHDYLLRNFYLFRMESTYEIREDIVDFVRRLKPRLDPSPKSEKTIFTGFARFAVPIISFAVNHVLKPKLGEIKPAAVKVSPWLLASFADVAHHSFCS